jgi:hypothetical protein
VLARFSQVADTLSPRTSRRIYRHVLAHIWAFLVYAHHSSVFGFIQIKKTKTLKKTFKNQQRFSQGGYYKGKDKEGNAK